MPDAETAAHRSVGCSCSCIASTPSLHAIVVYMCIYCGGVVQIVRASTDHSSQTLALTASCSEAAPASCLPHHLHLRLRPSIPQPTIPQHGRRPLE